MKQEGGSMLEAKWHVKRIMKQGDRTKGETYSETFIETCKREKWKTSKPYVLFRGMSWIVTAILSTFWAIFVCVLGEFLQSICKNIILYIFRGSLVTIG
jgi:hypothetical protein